MNACDKLEKNNIRSNDLCVGDLVNDYLNGKISRSKLKLGLLERRKEIMQSVKGIDKLFKILLFCPKKVKL
jgi:hypothetical protein